MLEGLTAVLNQLTEDVNQAWSLDRDLVFWGAPRKPSTAASYAVLDVIEPVERQANVRLVDETYKIDIWGRFPFPDDQPVLQFQIAQAKLLGDILVAPVPDGTQTFPSPDPYAGVASRWFVTEVLFSDSGEKDDLRCEVLLRFEVSCFLNE